MSALTPIVRLDTGYLHPGYAASLSEFGEPLELPRSGSWVLTRTIPNSAHRDAMSCYPLFFCKDWSQLAHDLDAQQDLLSLTVVTDPFAEVSEGELRRAFPDLARPFKEHYVIDLERQAPTSHHRRTARRALRDLTVEITPNPVEHLADWQRIYGELCKRRGVVGMRAFSRAAFQRQLTLPGCVAFRALKGEQCVAMNLWYVIGEIAYGHLLAADEEGYRRSAPYALIQTAINVFCERKLKWMLLGGGPGKEASEDGVVWFKKGWATGTRQTHLCGRVFSHTHYRQLSHARGLHESEYFPAYRQGEFV